MPSVAETAYPRLKNQISSEGLLEIYTPTDLELQFASRHTKGVVAKLGFLVLLKTFQRLGYFVLVKNVPDVIIKHIAGAAKIGVIPKKLENYDTSGTRDATFNPNSGLSQNYSLWCRCKANYRLCQWHKQHRLKMT